MGRLVARRRLQGSMEALSSGISFVARADRNRLRRLGPLAVLHPLRASHLLVLASENPTVLDTLTALLARLLRGYLHPRDGQRTTPRTRMAL